MMEFVAVRGLGLNNPTQITIDRADTDLGSIYIFFK